MLPKPPGRSFLDEELAARLKDGLRKAMIEAMLGVIDDLVATCVKECVGRFRDLQRELLSTEGDAAALEKGTLPEQPAADPLACREIGVDLRSSEHAGHAARGDGFAGSISGQLQDGATALGSSPRGLAPESEVEEAAEGDGQGSAGSPRRVEEPRGRRPSSAEGSGGPTPREKQDQPSSVLGDTLTAAVSVEGATIESLGETSAKTDEAASSRSAAEHHRHAENDLQPHPVPGLAGTAEEAPPQADDRIAEPGFQGAVSSMGESSCEEGNSECEDSEYLGEAPAKTACELAPAAHFGDGPQSSSGNAYRAMAYYPEQFWQQIQQYEQLPAEEKAEGDEAEQSEPAPTEPSQQDDCTAGIVDEAEAASLAQQEFTAVQLAGTVERKKGIYSILGQQTSSEVATKIKDALQFVDDSWLSTEWGTVSHRVWLVITGRDSNGPLVRQGQDLSSPICTGSHLSRLAPGTLVKQLKLVGQRLYFQRLSGTGPACGWVSTRVSGKQLLVRLFRTKSQGPPGSPANVDTCAGSSGVSLGECDIVPMGHYCITATLLKKYGWRRQALPLDWCAATFRVWNHMIADDFKMLLSPKGRKGEMHPYNKLFFPDVAMFIHQGGWASDDVHRRVARLRSLLEEGRAVGLAIYMDGNENCSQSLDELVEDGRRLLELARGFSHVVLVWIEEATSNPPTSEWLASFMSSGRMSVLRYSPSSTVNYYTRLSPTDSDCIAGLLSERFPTAFKRRGQGQPEDCPGAPDSGESDAERHWGDRFDESVYWKELARRVAQEVPEPADCAPKKPVISGTLSSKRAEDCKGSGGSAGHAVTRETTCQKCGAAERLVLDPIREGRCQAWDGVIYCSQCWMSWQEADRTSSSASTIGRGLRFRRAVRPI